MNNTAESETPTQVPAREPVGNCPAADCDQPGRNEFCGFCGYCWVESFGDDQREELRNDWSRGAGVAPVYNHEQHHHHVHQSTNYALPPLWRRLAFGLFCAAAGAGLVVAALEWMK